MTQTLKNKIGYEQRKNDYSLFTKRKGNKIVVFLVYVDNIMIAGNDQSLIKELNDIQTNIFMIKDLGEMKYFLGMEVARPKQGITLNQRKYAQEHISDMGYFGAKPCHTPLQQNTKFTTKKFDEKINLETKDKSVEDDASFIKLIGKLLYLTLTRSDLMFAVQTLSQFMHEPKVSNWMLLRELSIVLKKNQC